MSRPGFIKKDSRGITKAAGAVAGARAGRTSTPQARPKDRGKTLSGNANWRQAVADQTSKMNTYSPSAAQLYAQLPYLTQVALTGTDWLRSPDWGRGAGGYNPYNGGTFWFPEGSMEPSAFTHEVLHHIDWRKGNPTLGPKFLKDAWKTYHAAGTFEDLSSPGWMDFPHMYGNPGWREASPEPSAKTGLWNQSPWGGPIEFFAEFPNMEQDYMQTPMAPWYQTYMPSTPSLPMPMPSQRMSGRISKVYHRMPPFARMKIVNTMKRADQ